MFSPTENSVCHFLIIGIETDSFIDQGQDRSIIVVPNTPVTKSTDIDVDGVLIQDNNSTSIESMPETAIDFISKPRGSFGKPSSGGFSLPMTLGWSIVEYSKVQVSCC